MHCRISIPRILRTLLTVTLGVTLTGSVLSSCKREERPFRVEPPYAGTIESKVLSPLQPGGPRPTHHVKNDYEDNAWAVGEGKRLYQNFNCVGCHAHGGGGMGPPLMDNKWIYGGQPEQIFASIVEGRPNGMPSFRGKIPDNQLWMIVAYVRSMSGHVPADVAPNRDDNMQIGEPESSRPPQTPQKQVFYPKSGEAPQ